MDFYDDLFCTAAAALPNVILLKFQVSLYYRSMFDAFLYIYDNTSGKDLRSVSSLCHIALLFKN